MHPTADTESVIFRQRGQRAGDARRQIASSKYLYRLKSGITICKGKAIL
jgi:hypothetical protein